MRSNKFNIKNFSHFKLYSGNKIITIYPADDNGISFYNDKAILRAKEILERVNTADKRNLAKNLIGYVKKCLEAAIPLLEENNVIFAFYEKIHLVSD